MSYLMSKNERLFAVLNTVGERIFMKKTNKSSEKCPMETAPFKRVFEDFYFSKRDAGSYPNPPSEQDKNFDKQFIRGEPLPELLTYKDKGWKFIENINLVWEEGHLHNPKPIIKENLKGYPAHFHSDLSIFDEHFHIDFYGVSYWGLGSSLRETRVYKNGALIDRGGSGNAYILSFRQNLPLVIPFEDNILLFQKADYDNEKGELSIPASLWRHFPNPV
jgi:hypothetical protein